MRFFTSITRSSIALACCLVAGSANSETLLEIYNLATSNDPQFQASRASLEASKEALPQSTANFLPTLSATAGYTENSDADIGSSDRISLNLVQPLYKHGSFVERRRAKGAVTQAEANFRVAEQELILAVAQSYFNVLSARDSLEFAEAEKRSNARQLDQTQQRFDVGLVAITDVHESRAAYDISVAQAIEAENRLDSTKENLREITGRYHQELALLSDNMPLLPPTPNDLQEWTDLALDENPALQAAEAATTQAQENVNAQKSGHYPTLNLFVDHAESHTDDVRFDSSTTSTTATVQLYVPLYQGGATSSKVRQYRELLKRSRQVLEETRRITQRNVRNAYRGVLSGISRVKALKQALVSSESALKAAEAGYEVGTRTTVDVLVARRNQFSAQRDYSQARYNYLLDTLRLQQAAGQLGTDNLKTINDWLR